MGAERRLGSTAAMASSTDTARVTRRTFLSATFRWAVALMVTSPFFSRPRATAAAASPQARRSVSSSASPPWAVRVSKTQHSWPLPPASRAVSRSTARVQTSRTRYHSPAGSMAFTAS